MGMERVRIGGRSARVQASVHAAVKQLAEECDRSELTIPMIADRAGVTPSTIYRRWGALSELLADVAVEHLRPVAEPTDTGAVTSDLVAWVDQYMDEMSSEVGRTMIRDLLADAQDGRNANRCCQFTEGQLSLISRRANARGEAGFDVDRVLDLVIAPIIYRIVFSEKPLTVPWCHSLIDQALRPQDPD
ncbi:TetR/AcrR family transcriptional regulator [Lichenicola sp.]|uniref:TetR/AcrR family transcriptional regulator n=1 Tax=Lichenicola sp. TaxID=2804529 RepID=UPI003B008842